MKIHASRSLELAGTTVSTIRDTHTTGEVAAHAFSGHMIEQASPATSQDYSARRNAPIRMLQIAQVLTATGLSKTRIYELQARGDFPMRVQLTPRRVGWVEAEVQAWLAARIASNTSLIKR